MQMDMDMELVKAKDMGSNSTSMFNRQGNDTLENFTKSKTLRDSPGAVSDTQ